ncbi:DUF7507 domain-containing protein [Flavobacterium reichenbachii]|uniref:DUF7507 domain-containing protein n=1 Tax=Flavobacterium reichenbachii TaxID=362418 RepID=A0A085ZT43_9FLAO|nr:DUF11 domain-containing protein [Flavobacterium reichenbachii]KFF07607.1 hypothetical protein IW19_19780 [Flavobacterium reichenbachii]
MSLKTYPTNHQFLNKTILLFLLISFKSIGQTKSNNVTQIYTDWKGFWASSGITGLGNRPDTANNLLAFAWNGKTYSTGVDDNVLTANSVTFNTQKFRALKIQTLGQTTSTYFLQGSMIDGLPTTAKLTPPLAGSVSTGAELASRLTDGVNGLSLGTGIANIKSGTAEFKIGTNNINVNGVNDDIPDLIVTQVAETGSTADTFKFIDASGNTVGTEISVAFGSVPAIGTYSLDLFRADNGAVAFTPAETRNIRMLGIEIGSMGITSANASLVDRFVVTFSGSSDCAFIAFNTNSLKLAELSLVKSAVLSSCGKVGTNINYTFDVKNTGDVPITDISISDPLPTLTLSGNHIASLAPGATATITGTYKITAADVAAGRVINSAKVTGTDPSLNVIEDISGTDYGNNIATTTILQPAAPTASVTKQPTCGDLTGTITISSPAPAAGITYSIDGTVFTNTTGVFTGLSAGAYNNIKVKNSSGCESNAASVTINAAAAKVWNGSSSGNWNTASNWTPSGVPVSTDCVQISSAPNGAVISGTNTEYIVHSLIVDNGASLKVNSTNTLKVTNAVTVGASGSLIFEDSSSLLQTTTSGSVNTGNITYKRKTSVRRYDLTQWASPVTATPGFTLNNLSPLTLADKYYSYDASAAVPWVVNYGGTLPMAKGQGYSVRAPQTFDIVIPYVFEAEFKGVPNNGNISVTPQANKWTLIGNPYPSAVNASKLIGDNLSLGSLYFWTHNTSPTGTGGTYSSSDYAVYNLSGGTIAAPSGGARPSGYIGAGQSFFAKPNSAAAVVFTNEQRIDANNTQFYKTDNADKNRIWLNFTNTEGAFKQLFFFSDILKEQQTAGTPITTRPQSAVIRMLTFTPSAKAKN